MEPSESAPTTRDRMTSKFYRPNNDFYSGLTWDIIINHLTKHTAYNWLHEHNSNAYKYKLNWKWTSTQRKITPRIRNWNKSPTQSRSNNISRPMSNLGLRHDNQACNNANSKLANTWKCQLPTFRIQYNNRSHHLQIISLFISSTRNHRLGLTNFSDGWPCSNRSISPARRAHSSKPTVVAYGGRMMGRKDRQTDRRYDTIRDAILTCARKPT